MLDRIQIEVAGGDGGNGVVSYHREKFVPKGGPDGGDGGRGGRVYLRAVDDVYTLEQYRSSRNFKAANGGHGGPKLKHGSNGTDLYLDVPAGTVVTDAEMGEFLADLRQPGDKVQVAHAGRGGWGNKRFATSTNKTPSYSQKGQAGEVVELELELRLLADVGLIGLPNAGKSTFLSAVSNAKPKIAAYPFTTLEPMLGVVNSGFERFTLADLPGLIEGASEGHGLGFEFLKHIRRCRVLLHVIDCSSPDPVTDFELIEGELRAYEPGLSEVARVIAVTKADLDPGQARESAATLEAHTGSHVWVVSAVESEGTEALAAHLLELVKREKASAALAETEEVPILRPEGRERFSVSMDGDGRFVVEGRRVATFVEMMETGMEGSRDEVYRRLDRWGVSKALRSAGVQTGDTVVFGETSITWEA